MRSAKLTTSGSKLIIVFFLTVFVHQFSTAQENSPYSRYGLGNVVSGQNMTTRAMGGISAGYVDSLNFLFNSSSINLANPASLGSISYPFNTPNRVVFDLGGEIDMRTLKSNTTPEKYRATNTLISYLQIAFPITPKKMARKGNNWVMAFGLRPVTRVNYKVYQDKYLPGIDSITALYEGSGGLNQANISTGIRIKNFSFGVSSGFSFGTRNTSTKLSPFSDSVLYASSNSESNARYNGFFLNLGVQYKIKMKSGDLRLGASANLQQKLKAKMDHVDETFIYGSNGEVIPVDTVSAVTGLKGTVVVPATYTAGFTFTGKHWIFGADGEFTPWTNYSYFGTKDPVQNSFMIHAGGQYYPAADNTPTRKYWRFVRYRMGAYYGNDYVKLGNSRPVYAVTLGAGLPLTQLIRRDILDRFMIFNTGIELGQVGNKNSFSVHDNIFRINVGLSMSATWFQKRKYD